MRPADGAAGLSRRAQSNCPPVKQKLGVSVKFGPFKDIRLPVLTLEQVEEEFSHVLQKHRQSEREIIKTVRRESKTVMWRSLHRFISEQLTDNYYRDVTQIWLLTDSGHHTQPGPSPVSFAEEAKVKAGE